MENDDLGRLVNQSVLALRDYFSNKEPTKHDEVRAKVAASVFSTSVRLQQTQGSREALQWGIAQTLLDKEQLREYVRVSMPGSSLAKSLPASEGCKDTVT